MKRAQTVISGLTVLGLRVLGVTDLIKIQGHSEIAFGSQEEVGLDAHFSARSASLRSGEE